MHLDSLEEEIQTTLFEWFAWKHKDLDDVFFHVPNGGARHPAVGAKLKKQGVKKGIPDCVLAVARGVYHGLYLELKRKGEKPNEHQVRKIGALIKQGYYVKVSDNIDDAQKIIAEYLELR